MAGEIYVCMIGIVCLFVCCRSAATYSGQPNQLKVHNNDVDDQEEEDCRDYDDQAV